MEMEKQIYKNSKSKWTTKNKESPQWNEKLSRREIPNMKKLKDNFLFPNKEQVLLQSHEMEVILETKFKTEWAGNRSQSIMSQLTRIRPNRM
jgi:hypothetical protein